MTQSFERHSDLIDRAVATLGLGQRVEALALAEQVLQERALIEQEIQHYLDLRNQGQYGEAFLEIDRAIQRAGGGFLLGRLLHDRGTTLQGAKRFDKALDFLKAAYLLRRAAGDAIGASYSVFQIPMCRLVAGDPHEELKEEFHNAADILGQILIEEGDTLEVSDEGNLRQNLAFCVQFVGNYGGALVQ